MFRWCLTSALWFVLAMGLAGCVATPQDRLNREIDADELFDHVHFLAQPALRGRKPMTLGSRWARRYIVKRFLACGLEPWGQAGSYAQPFTIGTNMIGVLPGSDPNRADEIVIVCAHYDHLGRTEDGLCRGACDNASGVAALLEIAEALVMNPKRPARSICFAAFDQEENALLGAFAFSRRPDFHASKIAGVVNIDLQGRHGFEVLDNHLFVAGMAGFEAVQEALDSVDTDIEILPVGMDLVGARGDHVAFEGLDACTLFFTCGPYRDYHKPGDTPEKIDYDHVRAGSDVILAAIEVLSESEARLVCHRSSDDSMAELRSLKLTLDHVAQDPNALGLTTEQLPSLNALSEQLDGYLDSGGLDDQHRRKLLFKHFETLALFLSWPEDTYDPNEKAKEALQQHRLRWRGGLVSLDFQSELVAAGRAMVDHLAAHSSSLIWGVPDFRYHRIVLRDNYLHLTELRDDQYALVCTFLDLSLDVELPGLFKWPPRLKPSSEIGISFASKASVGTREEILDTCLLHWGRAISESEPNDCWGQIVSRVTDLPNDRTCAQWVKWRLDRQGFSDQTRWKIAALQSPNPFLARAAISQLPDRPAVAFEATLAGIIDDRQTHSYVRTGCITKVHRGSTAVMWHALVNAIDDTTLRQGLTFSLPEDHPQRDLMRFIDINRAKERQLRSNAYSLVRRKRKIKTETPPKTIGECALNRLEELSGQDFGLDKQAWRQWIECHCVVARERCWIESMP